MVREAFETLDMRLMRSDALEGWVTMVLRKPDHLSSPEVPAGASKQAKPVVGAEATRRSRRTMSIHAEKGDDGA